MAGHLNPSGFKHLQAASSPCAGKYCDMQSIVVCKVLWCACQPALVVSKQVEILVLQTSWARVGC